MDPPATSTSCLARAERAARSTLPPLIEPSLSSRVINWFSCFLPANMCSGRVEDTIGHRDVTMLSEIRERKSIR